MEKDYHRLVAARRCRRTRITRCSRKMLGDVKDLATRTGSNRQDAENRLPSEGALIPKQSQIAFATGPNYLAWCC